jgi:sulfatase maturation enzyme AslB (radical SAM superfamily)
MVNTGQNVSYHELFLSDFQHISDFCAIEPLHGWSAGFNPNKTDRTVCPSSFYTMTVDANGDAGCCCVDWAHGTKLGNVFETPLLDIWNGENMRRFRIMQLEGKRCQNPACRGCDFVNCFMDDIDGHQVEMLKKFNPNLSPFSARYPGITFKLED